MLPNPGCFFEGKSFLLNMKEGRPISGHYGFGGYVEALVGQKEGSWGLTNFAAQPLPTDRGHRGIAHFMSYGSLITKVLFIRTRSYAALRAADLDWIVGPGYSLGQVHSGEKP